MQPLSPPEWNSFARFRIRYDQGDLLTNVAFRIKLSGLPNRIPEGGTQYETGWCDEVANAMIEYVELQIGEIPISRLHSDYLTIHSEHNVTQTKQFAKEAHGQSFRTASRRCNHSTRASDTTWDARDQARSITSTCRFGFATINWRYRSAH